MKSKNELNPAIPPDRGRELGEARKRAALDLHEARRDDIIRRGRRAFIQRLLDHGTATADDVANAIEVPAEIDGRCLGAIPSQFARGGIIEIADYTKSTRPSRHASIIAVWRLIDEQAACRWLALNPAPTDADNDPTVNSVETIETKKVAPGATSATNTEGRTPR